MMDTDCSHLFRHGRRHYAARWPPIYAAIAPVVSPVIPFGEIDAYAFVITAMPISRHYATLDTCRQPLPFRVTAPLRWYNQERHRFFHTTLYAWLLSSPTARRQADADIRRYASATSQQRFFLFLLPSDIVTPYCRHTPG